MELDGNSEAFSWIQEGRRHRAELELDGETGREGIYQLQLRYQDRTGHPLCGGQAGEEDGGILAAVKEGVCVSTPFALDSRGAASLSWSAGGIHGIEKRTGL